jgi:hypothetical protein
MDEMRRDNPRDREEWDFVEILQTRTSYRGSEMLMSWRDTVEVGTYVPDPGTGFIIDRWLWDGEEVVTVSWYPSWVNGNEVNGQ